MTLHALNTAIYSKLGGTATAAGTAVFFNIAPDTQPLPYIVFDYTGDLDENINPSRLRNALIFARAYAATPAQAGAIDGQVDALLHLQTMTVTGWANFWTARENGFSLAEPDQAGRITHMAGAEYRIRLTKE